ncbi:hypothetical protein LCGC14_0846450 [marine sediment metagenome]|uniref:Uncharacterized protein n=1 Tax=marine sediment metagenome TaxID=412755 RepID=A0A0F9PWT4_9ZZZZ
MSYICDSCGKTEKLAPTKKGEHLCRICMVKKSLKPKIDFCCRCMTITPHDLYGYRGRRKGEYYSECKRCKIKTDVKNCPTKEDLIGHRKVDLIHEYDNNKVIDYGN